jgi:hypothetical protein
MNPNTKEIIPSILMASVSDSLGGITNITMAINISSIDSYESIDFSVLEESKDSD